jgi:hypothetical protein
MGLLAYLLCMTAIVAPVIAYERHQLRRAAWRSTPAAPDNQPGSNAQLLAACEQIASADTRKENPRG